MDLACKKRPQTLCLFQREYLERCEDRKSYNYLASDPLSPTRRPVTLISRLPHSPGMNYLLHHFRRVLWTSCITIGIFSERPGWILFTCHWSLFL
jgi:hypothetical protein